MAHGYYQGYLYHTYAPVVYLTTVGTALAVVCKEYTFFIHYVYIKTVFIHGEIYTEVWVLPPDGWDRKL